jgi:hypothetical protein
MIQPYSTRVQEQPQLGPENFRVAARQDRELICLCSFLEGSEWQFRKETCLIMKVKLQTSNRRYRLSNLTTLENSTLKMKEG